jgi:hypothetical protein
MQVIHAIPASALDIHDASGLPEPKRCVVRHFLCRGGTEWCSVVDCTKPSSQAEAGLVEMNAVVTSSSSASAPLFARGSGLVLVSFCPNMHVAGPAVSFGDQP